MHGRYSATLLYDSGLLMNCDVDWGEGAGSKLIIKRRREGVTSFNAHAGIYLPFSKVDSGFGFWLFIASLCNRRPPVGTVQGVESGKKPGLSLPSGHWS